MRIALILASNLYMSPYVRYYTELLEKCGIAYDIIAWNRFGVPESGIIALNLPSSLHKSMLGKLVDYLHYRRFVRLQLIEGNYDKVVVFTIANALILSDLLKARYKNNYIFDIRDYWGGVKWLPFRFRTAVRNAAATIISSAGFKQWLPSNTEYLICHNTSQTTAKDALAKIYGLTRYKILTIGAIGYFDANRALIESLADDPMFELQFVGSGFAEQMLKDFVMKHRIKNVVFEGRYVKEDEPKFLEGISLMSILIDDSINSITCMSNRFYLSLVYGIPMMVDRNTEQARWVEKYNLGVIIDKKKDINQQIIQFLQAYDADTFDTGRRACLEVIRQDNVEFESKFKEFLAN